MAKLNVKQQLFLRHYLETLNATQSLIKAGYKTKYADKEASRLLQNPLIKREIEVYRGEIQRKGLATFEEKVNLLWQIANDSAVATDDKIKAIEVLNRMQGHFAPDKQVNINLDFIQDDMKAARDKYLNVDVIAPEYSK